MVSARRARHDARSLRPNRALRQQLRRIRVRAAAQASPRARERARLLCYALCGACGYLDALPSRDSFRAEGGATPALRHACPHCGARAWHDLNDEGTALALRDAETRERRYHHALARRQAALRSFAAGFALAMPVGLLLYQLAALTLTSAAVVSSLVLLAVAIPLFDRAVPRRHAQLRDAGAFEAFTRWRAPLPLVETQEALTRSRDGVFAAVECDAELLVAPLSGTRCVGYEVSLYRDASEQSPVCVLREQRCLEFRHGDVVVDGDAVTLSIPRVPIPRRGPAAPNARAFTKMLRRRGLYLADGPYRLEEALVLPGERYELRRVVGADDYVLAFGRASLPVSPRALAAGSTS